MLKAGVYHVHRKHNVGFYDFGVPGWNQGFHLLVNNISLDTVYISHKLEITCVA